MTLHLNLYRFKRQVSFKTELDRPNKHIFSVITQLRTGYAKLNDYLHKLGLKESNACECGEPETVEHYLLDCEMYFNAREYMRTEIFNKTGQFDLTLDLLLTENKDETFYTQRDVDQMEKKLSLKREGYLEWSDYFMAIAFLSAQRSKDPKTQVGACIVNEEKKIVGIGYNGMPNGCDDDTMPWGREAEDILDTKQLYVCHAELNAVLNKNSADVKNCTIYVALFPCNECAKVVIQSGIKEVVYYSDKYHAVAKFAASRRMFDMAGVIYRQYRPQQKKIVIDFGIIDEMTNGVTTSMESLSVSTKSPVQNPDSTS